MSYALLRPISINQLGSRKTVQRLGAPHQLEQVFAPVAV